VAPQDYENMSKDDLYTLAQERDLDGRSDMNKHELVAAHEQYDNQPQQPQQTAPPQVPGAQPASTQASTARPDPDPQGAPAEPQGVPLEQAAVQPGVIHHPPDFDPAASTPADAEQAQAEADATQAEADDS
jgi:hypothetical protein